MFNLNLGGTEIKEIPIVPVGEGQFKIEKLEVKVGSKKDPNRVGLNVQLSSLDHPECSEVFAYLSIPNSGDSDKASTLMNNQLIEFSRAFDVPLDGDVDENSVVGNVGYADIHHSEFEGRISAKVKRFIIAR